MAPPRAAPAPPLLAATAEEAAGRFGDRPAVVTPDGWALTYAQLAEVAGEVAGGLSAHGLGPDDVLALLLPQGPEYLVAYLAAARLGVATAGVNARLAVPGRRRVLATADPDLLLGTPDLLEGLDPEAETHAVTPAGEPAGVLHAWRQDGRAPAAAARDDRPVAIVFTSGTTGPPRGAVFTDRQLDAIRRIDAGDGWGGGGDMLVSTEPVHVGFMTKLAWYLRRGMTMHQLEHWRAGPALRTVAEHGISTVGGIPAQIALMLRHPDFDDHDLSAVETIVTGGGPASPALIREARRRFGAGFSVRYSSTESGGVGTGTDPEGPDREVLHTAGRPRTGVGLAILDEDGAPVPDGEVGTVALRSEAVMERYWRAPEATAATLVDGWLRTDDLGRADRQGCLRLAGRRSETWVRGGYNVHPQQVEAALSTHPDVASVGVAPRPDPVMGSVGVAVVVPEVPGRAPSLDELREHGRRGLATHELPEDLVVVDELPHTSLHKLDRDALADVVGDGDAPA